MSPGQSSDLKTVLARGGPLDPARAVNVVRQVAAAIEHAHAHQTVHSDITPATIWLGGDDTVYVADTATGTPSTDRTRTLVTNNATTYLADVHALAAVLYECLTGHPPTADPDAPVPRPSQQQAGVPAGFDDVVARGLAENPPDAFRTTAELVAAAQDALPVTAPATPSNQPTSVAVPLPKPSQNTTQTIHLPPAGPSTPPSQPAAGPTPKPPGTNPEQSSWNPDYGRSPTISFPHSRPIPLPAQPPPQRRRRRLLAPVLAALVILGVVTAGAIAIPRLVGHTTSRSTPTTPIAPAGPRTYKAEPTKLPFPELDQLKSVAVDGTGNIYVLAALLNSTEAGSFGRGDYHVFKLAPGAGAATAMEIPSVDMRNATDMTVDPGGTLYVSDRKAVWQLSPGSTSPIRLPFRGFVSIEAIAVDTAGNAYAAGPLTMGGANFQYGVKKLVPGDTKPTELTFPNLFLPHGLTVDRAGNIYVCAGIKDTGRGQVLKLAAGAQAPIALTIPEATEPVHAAADSSGNLFISDETNKGLFQVPAGTNTAIRVPMSTRTRAVAVDATGTLYVTTLATKDRTTDKIVKSAEVLKVAPDH